MVGFEYELWYFTLDPSFYVIRKNYRSSPVKFDLVDVYYIVQGKQTFY